MGDDLCKDLAAGKVAAFREVYDLHGIALFRTALRLLGSRHDAEDAVQEVFTGLARSRKKLGEVNNLRAYLFTSLRHCVTHAMKDRSQRARLVQQVPRECISQSNSSEDLGGILWQMAGQLPAEQHVVLALKLQGGLTFREIGEVCQISADTAASRYRYAVEKLRNLLEAK